MDRTTIEARLHNFKERSERDGYPLADLCVEEAYPGDNSTSYILKVTAPWVDDMDCSEALNILTDIMFDTVDIDTRKKIFSLEILDSNDEFHCRSGVEEAA